MLIIGIVASERKKVDTRFLTAWIFELFENEVRLCI